MGPLLSDPNHWPDGGSRPATVTLAVAGITKVYGGTVALAGADLEVWAGEIHGLLGENGAGKSTLVRILAGLEPADGGTVSVFGEELPSRFSPEDVAHRGVAFIHQQLGLVPDLSVAENVALVAGWPRRGPFIDWREVRRRASEVLSRMGVDLAPNDLVANLPIGMQSAIAIARSLALDARLLVLDEPTATLASHEAETLFGILRRLRSEGVAIVIISHRLDEILALTDRVTVLRDGRVVGTLKTQDVTEADLVRLILGGVLESDPHHETPHLGATTLELLEVRSDRLGPVSFELRKGEVLGVTGLAGSGHTTVGRVVFGLAPLDEGEIRRGGQPYRPSGPRAAMAQGLAFVPADRNTEGAVPTLDLRENLFLNPPVPAWKPLLRSAERRAAAETLEAFDVRPPAPDAEFSTLSGGNAQKVVLARCLSGRPEVLVLEEPTAAVDVGARAEIHRRLRQAAANGAGVLVVTSDLEEVEQVCDRAVVLVKGRVAQVLQGEGVAVSALAQAAYGG